MKRLLVKSKEGAGGVKCPFLNHSPPGGERNTVYRNVTDQTDFDYDTSDTRYSCRSKATQDIVVWTHAEHDAELRNGVDDTYVNHNMSDVCTAAASRIDSSAGGRLSACGRLNLSAARWT